MNFNRITNAQLYINMCFLISRRSTCSRRKVGCITVNDKQQLLSTGFNGVPYGMQHCTEEPCPGANYKHGQGLDRCLSIHAEQNALLQCKNVNEIHTVYCTDSPCMHCIKLLANTACKRIVYSREYANIAEINLFWETSGENRSMHQMTSLL